eukprot:378497-Alexandrium_andersonii.AAC.1
MLQAPQLLEHATPETRSCLNTTLHACELPLPDSEPIAYPFEQVTGGSGAARPLELSLGPPRANSKGLRGLWAGGLRMGGVRM